MSLAGMIGASSAIPHDTRARERFLAAQKPAAAHMRVGVCACKLLIRGLNLAVLAALVSDIGLHIVKMLGLAVTFRVRRRVSSGLRQAVGSIDLHVGSIGNAQLVGRVLSDVRSDPVMRFASLSESANR